MLQGILSPYPKLNPNYQTLSVVQPGGSGDVVSSYFIEL